MVEDFGGYSEYLKHANNVPVDQNGEILEMEGDLPNLFYVFYGRKFKPSLEMTEKQHRQ